MTAASPNQVAPVSAAAAAATSTSPATNSETKTATSKGNKRKKGAAQGGSSGGPTPPRSPRNKGQRKQRGAMAAPVVAAEAEEAEAAAKVELYRGRPVEQASTPATPDDFILENGLRYVKPYFFDFICNVKQRWAGMTVVQLFASEFPARPREYYLQAYREGRLRLQPPPAAARAREQQRQRAGRQQQQGHPQQTPPQQQQGGDGDGAGDCGGGRKAAEREQRGRSGEAKGEVEGEGGAHDEGPPLKGGQTVRHFVHRHEPPVLYAGPIEVAAATPDIVAVGKPPTMPVHVSGQYRKNTVAGVLQAERSDLGTLLPVHRLDRPVSGVLLFARSPAAANALRRDIEGRTVEKVYLARVLGVFPSGLAGSGVGAAAAAAAARDAPPPPLPPAAAAGDAAAGGGGSGGGGHGGGGRDVAAVPGVGPGPTPGSIRVDAPLSWDPGQAHASVPPRWRRPALPAGGTDGDNGTAADTAAAAAAAGAETTTEGSGGCGSGSCGRHGRGVADDSGGGNAKEAVTDFVLRCVAPDGRTSLVECRPRTGRSHQIRAHLSHLGFPIANDAQYGGTAYPGPTGARFAPAINGGSGGGGGGGNGRASPATVDPAAAPAEASIGGGGNNGNGSPYAGAWGLCPAELRDDDRGGDGSDDGNGNNGDGDGAGNGAGPRNPCACPHCPRLAPQDWQPGATLRPLWLHALRYSKPRQQQQRAGSGGGSSGGGGSGSAAAGGEGFEWSFECSPPPWGDPRFIPPAGSCADNITDRHA